MDENKFAELSAMLAKKMHQIQRALQVLQGLDLVTLRNDDGGVQLMVCDHAVDHAVAILQEGQQC